MIDGRPHRITSYNVCYTKLLRDVARYIVANPLRAGLVERVGDYPYWDAVWLTGPEIL